MENHSDRVKKDKGAETQSKTARKSHVASGAGLWPHLLAGVAVVLLLYDLHAQVSALSLDALPVSWPDRLVSPGYLLHTEPSGHLEAGAQVDQGQVLTVSLKH